MENFSLFKFGPFVKGIVLEDSNGFALAAWATIKHEKFDRCKLFPLASKTIMEMNEYMYQSKTKILGEISALPPRRCIVRRYSKSIMVRQNYKKFKQLNYDSLINF